MSITQQELGRRIRTAREACHMTQEDVAAQLGVSRSGVAQIEAGNRSVSSLELDRLAFIFGRDIREFVSESFEEEKDALTALFRVQSNAVEQPEVLNKLRECMSLGRQLTNLERLLGINRDIGAAATYPMAVPKGRWEAVLQGARLADEERRRLGLGFAPLPDLAELLETQGVRTGMVDLPDDVSGLTLSDKQVGLFVVTNQAHPTLRRRFSFAHEYAHVVADRDRFGLISRSSESADLIEVRANSFAACFLMPEDGVRQFIASLGKGKQSRAATDVFDEADAISAEARTEPGTQDIQLYDVVQFSHHFGVSRISALYRLKNLKIIDAQEFDSLKAQDTEERARALAHLLDLPEPDHDALRGTFRHRFMGLALEAYRRDEISLGKFKELASMVKVSGDELDAWLEGAGIAPA